MNKMYCVNIIGFTGTQIGMNAFQKKQFRGFILQNRHLIGEFHHGDCIGADEQAHNLIKITKYTNNILTIIHPPIIRTKRAFCNGYIVLPEKEYIERNHDIVNACTLLIAAPKNHELEELRSGTWATVIYARKIHKDVLILKRW